MELVLGQSHKWISESDRTLIVRVVGFLEYAAALRYFDELISIATPEELRAVDQLIQERPEFTIHVNLAQGFAKRPSALLPVGRGNNARQGLAWVMALARVELGAILATFDAHPEPFGVVRPSELELAAYQEILLDDAEAHFWSLSGDPNVERLFDAKPSREILAYIRRLSLAIALVRAAAQSRSGQWTNIQVDEMVQQYQQLRQVRGVYQVQIQAFLSYNNREVAAMIKECCRLLERDDGELAVDQPAQGEQSNNSD